MSRPEQEFALCSAPKVGGNLQAAVPKMDGSGAAVPWDELVVDGNLQKLLKAIVQRLDRHDKAIAGQVGMPILGALDCCVFC